MVAKPVTCNILKCNHPEVAIVIYVAYGSRCLLNCLSKLSALQLGNGDHLCDDVNGEGASVKWRSVGRSVTDYAS